MPVDQVSSLALDGNASTEDEDFFIYHTYITLGFVPSAGHKRIELIYNGQ